MLCRIWIGLDAMKNQIFVYFMHIPIQDLRKIYEYYAVQVISDDDEDDAASAEWTCTHAPR